jgi:hypothetical protein
VDDQNTPVESNEPRGGRVLMGALLVAAGAALLIERMLVLPSPWRTTIWPILLMAYGAARLTQPNPRGRQGLFFIVAGAWWLAGVSGWVAMDRTWPVLLVGLGLSIMLQSMTSGGASGVPDLFARRHRAGAGPWILLAILFGAAVSSGLRPETFAATAPSEGFVRVYSVVGGTNAHVNGTPFTGGEVVSVMGGSVVDLRNAVVAPGETVTLNVFALMGGGSIRVPEGWTVDLQVVPIFGSARDSRFGRRGFGRADDFDRERLFERSAPGDRDASAQPAAPGEPGAAAPTSAPPHLIIRGSVIMGGFAVRS